MRLLYACSELGLGHANRTLALGRRLLQRGHEIHFFTGGKAYTLLQKEFQNVHPVTPVGWYENNSGIVTTASLINILFPLPVYNSETGKIEVKPSNAQETTRRYYDLRRDLRALKPELLIADGDLNALRMAERWHIPAVYVTNLIRPSYGFNQLLNPGERITERYVKNCQKIIIPDNPPPNTICQYNIGDPAAIGVADKTEYVGSFFDTTPTTGEAKHIFAPVSGPYGTRAKLLNVLLPVLQELNVPCVLSLGVPGEKKTGRFGNCHVHNWLSTTQRADCMRDASVVVFSGGHITCFETVKYAKPSICIPTQPEQEANAAKLQDMQCSILAKNRRQLRDALRSIEQNYAAYKRNMERLNDASNKHDGLKRAVEIVEETRLQSI
jgi:UDP-N-acetylglucosamine--N-acetylmuramyl-(pentapeptide) pyrophosphoryl-undecaprenol N-acetylglucosamine transferase